jgi:hypothetical protein
MDYKEKAEELVDKYYLLLKESKGYYDLPNAIQCALIAVAEILKETPMYTGNLNPKWVYWNRVMDEIEKL